MIADAQMAILLGVIALVSSAILPLAVKPVLARIGVIDVPNARSSHSMPTLRGGGLAPLLAWIMTMAIAIFLNDAVTGPVLILLLAAGAAAILGLVDDLRDLRAGQRLGVQLAIGVIASTAICTIFGISYPWMIIGAVTIVGYINVANFIDGINGISGAHGVIAGVSFFIAGVSTSQSWLATSGLILAGVFMGFVPWNLRRPHLFLGDVGSYLLGGVIGVVAVMAIAAGVSPLLIVSPLAVFLADTTCTMIRRLIRGEGILSAHRTHAYQRLTDTGLSHPAVALIVFLMSAASAGIGYATWRLGLPDWIGWSAIVVLSSLFVAMPRLRGSVLPPSPKTPLPLVANVVEAPAAQGARQRWAVFGASGFVGSALVDHLRRGGFTVVELRAPRLECDPAWLDGSAIARDAAMDPAIVSVVERLEHVDIVVNAAGVAAPDGDPTPQLWGANAYLPAVLAEASRRSGATRFIHLSSAAVQGRTKVLDESPRVAPFSPYSRSKALGEIALVHLANDKRDSGHGVVIVRATSVQGPGRPTTLRLRRLASSRFSSVAAPGDQASVVSGLHGLTATVEAVGDHTGPVPGIVLQPWEGLSVTDVLIHAGRGTAPMMLPRWLCRSVLQTAYAAGWVAPEIAGLARRVEMMWFGQEQEPGWAESVVKLDPNWLVDVLSIREAEVAKE